MKHSISFYNILLFIIIFINIQCYFKYVQGTTTTTTANNNNNNNSYDNIINDVIAIINKGDIISAENKVMNHIDNGNDNDKSDIWYILSSIKYRQQEHTTGYEFATKAIELASTITTNGNKLIPDYYSTAADHAMQIGKTNECKELLETSLQTWPKHGQSLLLLGKLHQYSISSDLIAKGQSKDAVDKVYLDATKYYERYLELFPEEHGIRNDLALLLMNFPNRRNDGKKHYEIAIQGGNIFAMTNYATYLNKIGEKEKSVELQYIALDTLRKSNDPNIRQHEAGLLNNLGSALDGVSDDREEEAMNIWKKAIEIDPKMIPSLDSLANKISDNGDLDTASELLKRAEDAARENGNIPRASAAKFKRLTLLPRVYKSLGDVFKTRARYLGGLEELLMDATTGKLVIHNHAEAVTDLGYHLIFHGLHDQIARAHYYQILKLSAPHLSSFTASHVRPNIVPDRLQLRMGNTLSETNRIKVAFFSHYFREHSVGKLLRGIIAELSQLPVFDVIVIIPPMGGMEDEFTKEIIDKANYHILLDSEDPIYMRETIARLELDIMIYGEIGMAHSAYFLSFSRLAYRTVMFWGHGITSGNDKIDYFISSNLMETPYAQSHYVERLYLMPSICTYFLPPILPAMDKTHSDFGIPMDYFGSTTNIEPHLYLIPTSLYKLNPVMDEAIRKLLEKDPLGLLLMVDGKRSTWKNILNERMSKSMPPDVFQRIIWVKPMVLKDYLAFIKLGAVIMFTYPTASGVTVMEALSVGTPFVVYEGHSLGMTMRIEKGYLKALELDDINCCLAYSIDDFVDKLYKFGNDKEYRNRISAEMLRKVEGRLFRNKEVINDWIEFLHFISRTPQPLANRLLTLPGIVGGKPRLVK